MFQSPVRQHLVYKACTYRHRPHLAITGCQTSLKLHPFRRNMSIAFRAVREDGSGMQWLNFLIYSLLIPAVEDISEADLYQYTRHRWVYGYGNPHYWSCVLTSQLQ